MRNDDDRALLGEMTYLREALEEDIPYLAAESLGTLLQAEEDGVISRHWREQIQVDAAERLVVERRRGVELEWGRDYEHLDRMLSVGRLDTGEEALLVLMLRSTLEAAKVFVPGSEERLASLDEALRAELRSNEALYRRERQGRKRAYLAKRLPGHWWWRP